MRSEWQMMASAPELDLIRTLQRALDAAGVSWWLFGGWALDALLGEITRPHGDVEVWVAKSDSERSEQALRKAGLRLLATQPAEESKEYECAGLTCSTAFFVAQADGSFAPEGRWSDWRFPPGSFADASGRLGDLVVPTMSAAGMLAMKEQYASLRNGKPLRPKDLLDIPLLRKLAATEQTSS